MPEEPIPEVPQALAVQRIFYPPKGGIVLLLAFIAYAMISTRGENSASVIKTMSFNIRADFNFGAPSNDDNAWISNSGNHRRDLATTVISEHGPDILGVQEAFNHQVNDLTAALPEYDFYGVGRNDGTTAGEYSGIFYRDNRFTRTNQGTFWLSLTPDTPSVYQGATFRIASWVILQDSEADNREYVVLNSHWAQGHAGTRARNYSAGLVRERLETIAGDRPIIVMGDLNLFEHQVAYDRITSQNDPNGFQLLDSYREIYSTQGPNERTNHGYIGHIDGKRIDYILHTDGFQAAAADIVHTNYNGSFPSDHYPITSTLVLNPEGDFDADGDVDGIDFLAWQIDASSNPQSSSDLAIWESNYGAISSLVSSALASVPEPCAGIILTMGVGTLLLRRSAHNRICKDCL